MCYGISAGALRSPWPSPRVLLHRWALLLALMVPYVREGCKEWLFYSPPPGLGSEENEGSLEAH